MIRPEVTSLPLFAQLWNSLSGWPTPRSRAVIRGITDFKVHSWFPDLPEVIESYPRYQDVEVPPSRPPVEKEPKYENSEEDDEEDLYDMMPVSDAVRFQDRVKISVGMICSCPLPHPYAGSRASEVEGDTKPAVT